MTISLASVVLDADGYGTRSATLMRLGLSAQLIGYPTLPRYMVPSSSPTMLKGMILPFPRIKDEDIDIVTLTSGANGVSGLEVITAPFNADAPAANEFGFDAS